MIDCLAGISAPAKAGPMLRYADQIVVTKADLVSPTECEVFLHNVRIANMRAGIGLINGLTGSGKTRLLEDIEYLALRDTPSKRKIYINGKLSGQVMRDRLENHMCAYLAQSMNFVMELRHCKKITSYSACLFR